MAEAEAGGDFFASLPLYIEVSGRLGFNDALNGLYKRGHIHEGKIYYTQLFTPYTIRWNAKKKRWFFDWRGLCKDDVASACVSEDVASPHLVKKDWLVFDGKAWVKDPLINVQVVEDPQIPERKAFPGADPAEPLEMTAKRSPAAASKRRKPRKKSRTSRLMASMYEKVFMVESGSNNSDKKKIKKQDPTMPKSPEADPTLESSPSLSSLSEEKLAAPHEADQWIAENMKKQADLAKKSKGRNSLNYKTNLIALNQHRKRSMDLREREARLRALEADLLREKEKIAAQKDALETQVLGFAKSQELQASLMNLESEKKSNQTEQKELDHWREKYETLVNQIEEYEEDHTESLASVGITEEDVSRWTSNVEAPLDTRSAGELEQTKSEESTLWDEHIDLNDKLLKNIRSMNSQLDLNPFLGFGDFPEDSDEIQGGDFEAQMKEWESNPMSDLFKPDFGAAKLDVNESDRKKHAPDLIIPNDFTNMPEPPNSNEST